MKSATTPFDNPSADVIIRTSDHVNFSVFNVILSKASAYFKDMFSLPKVENAEGETDDKPLFLDGILKDDFHAFLTALSAFDYESTLKGKPGKVKFVVAR